MNEGLLLLRLVFGIVMAAHGSQKLFGWFGGHGIAGTGGFFESLGFRPGKLFATAAGLGEFFGGLLIAAGFLGPVGPALVLSVMTVASISVHWKNGLFAQNNGFEVPLLYATAGVAMAFTRFGAFSIDAILGISASPLFISAALLVGIVGALGTLAMRNVNAAAQSSAR